MMPWWVLAVLVVGANFAVWGTVGLCRLVGDQFTKFRGARARRAGAARVGGTAQAGAAPAGRVPADGPPAGTAPAGTAPADSDVPAGTQSPAGVDAALSIVDTAGACERHPPRRDSLTVHDIAVLIPAHNEAVVIEDSLTAIMKLVPRKNVHVVSDGSTDRTVQIARKAGASVIETRENLGKAGALREAISLFRLVERFAAVMLLDADTRVQPGYFATALPLFDNPAVVAVAGAVKTSWDRKLSLTGNVLVGHRQRIYAIGQRALKFGQTSSHLNATHIVPGFASMYRSDVLPRIDMNPPGLAIEDFNMTFEVYQKRLGKVGFKPSAVAVTQDPDNVRDYVRQTKRWSLGLWQTVRRHPPRANLFTAMLSVLLLELVTASLLFLLIPLLLVVLLLPDFGTAALSWPWFGAMHAAVAAHVTLRAVFFGIVVPDYALTCLAALLERRPRLLLCGVFFPVLRAMDAAIALYAVPLAWLARSSGRWTSPARRNADSQMAADHPAGQQIDAVAPLRGTGSSSDVQAS